MSLNSVTLNRTSSQWLKKRCMVAWKDLLCLLPSRSWSSHHSILIFFGQARTFLSTHPPWPGVFLVPSQAPGIGDSPDQDQWCIPKPLAPVMALGWSQDLCCWKGSWLQDSHWTIGGKGALFPTRLLSCYSAGLGMWETSGHRVERTSLRMKPTS